MSKSLVNGDSLKKYHAGVNTPHVSDVLVNENVASFKVGTSNVTNVDLSNQIDGNLYEINRVVGKSLVSNYNIHGVDIYTLNGTKKIYSINSEIYDEYKANRIIRRIKRFTQKDFTRSDFMCGSDANWNQSGSTYSFYTYQLGINFANSESSISNTLPLNPSIEEVDTPGFKIVPSYGWVGFRVLLSDIGASPSDSLATKKEKALDWFFNHHVEFLVEVTPSIEEHVIIDGIGDDGYSHVVSNIPTRIEHTVSLNAKSQTNTIILSVKRICDNIRNYTDISMKIDGNGYIKFPSAFGGLLVQWGRATQKVNESSARIDFPTSFSEDIYNVQLTGAWNNTSEHYWVQGASDLRKYMYAEKNGRKESSDNVYWFAIGK